METKLVLTEYERDALLVALESYVQTLDDQEREIARMKHGNADRKEIRRTLEKRAQLLKGILAKIR